MNFHIQDARLSIVKGFIFEGKLIFSLDISNYFHFFNKIQKLEEH